MNYFDLYDLPLSFHPDPVVVKQKFYALSKKFHPDFYINESQQKQEEVLELSTLNNKAYQVLNDPHKLLFYILELKGVLKEGENYVLPQDFLMDMMEINEALMDLQFEPDPGKLIEIKVQVDAVEKSLFDELLALTSSFDHQQTSVQDKVLGEIKDLYYRNKYVLRLRETLDK